MSICQSCGGGIGRDCFNPSECAWIAEQQQQAWIAAQQQQPAIVLSDIGHGSLSLRDYFAGQALTAILSHRDAFEDSGEREVARMAYMQADAMLAIRAEHDDAVAIAEQLAASGGAT